MAKTTKSEKSDRQKVIDDIRRKQRSAEKRQGFLIVGVCIFAALVIVGLAAFNPVRTWWEQRKYDNEALADIGGPASVCQDVEEKPATGSAQHVQPAQVEYTDAPPAFGDHWLDENSPAPITERFYTADERPELETLVHNLEHGFTILWYDETAADDATMLGEIKAIADRLNDSDTNNRLSFIAAPWTEEDGEEFPDGQHIAFTHWRVAEDDKQFGVWQYCSEPSGEALEQFMKDYPYTDAPEPIGGYGGDQ
ncbi:DUF3105 domain-containing protein [Nocardioides antri]|uniref:DUF3105 domain-containing protein n=1 Tax=Nocardioides antri TaxID=2607659 RepID=A0A5B1M2D4_9ACTN|nr:DUF3105 domain-containing protein [Nocardioides antri]KAA1427112.1 DUF3105 domain-containing protein [Nocardioides antri]